MGGDPPTKCAVNFGANEVGPAGIVQTPSQPWARPVRRVRKVLGRISILSLTDVSCQREVEDR